MGWQLDITGDKSAAGATINRALQGLEEDYNMRPFVDRRYRASSAEAAL